MFHPLKIILHSFPFPTSGTANLNRNKKKQTWSKVAKWGRGKQKESKKTYMNTVWPEKISSVQASTVPGIICKATINMSQKPVLSEGRQSAFGVGNVVTDKVMARKTLRVPMTHSTRLKAMVRVVQSGQIRPTPKTVKTTEVITKVLAGEISDWAAITSKPRSLNKTSV